MSENTASFMDTMDDLTSVEATQTSQVEVPPTYQLEVTSTYQGEGQPTYQVEVTPHYQVDALPTYQVEATPTYQIEATPTYQDETASISQCETPTSSSTQPPLSSTGEVPTVVTLAPPKPSFTDRSLTVEELEKLRSALNTNSVPTIAQAVRSVKVLAIEIRKQSAQALHLIKPKPVKRKNPPSANHGDGNDTGNGENGAIIIKKRAPRTQSTERRRPWKPERLDNTKPILQCDACGYQANRRDYMRRHQIRVHSDYRPYQCTLCDFKTTEKHDLDRHMNSKYHGGKGLSQKKPKMTATVRIKCDQCNYSTKSVNSILKHKQIHALQRQQDALFEEELGGEPVDSADDETGLTSSLPTTQDNRESLDDTDPVTVIMMEDLVARAQEQAG